VLLRCKKHKILFVKASKEEADKNIVEFKDGTYCFFLRPRSYRAVNTRHSVYRNQSVKDVSDKICFFFILRSTQATEMYSAGRMKNFLVVKLLVHKADVGLYKLEENNQTGYGCAS